MAQITTVFSQIITWIGSFVSALLGTEGALADLAPYFFISIGVSIILVSIKVIRKLVWGA